jgi:hypothetical protein
MIYKWPFSDPIDCHVIVILMRVLRDKIYRVKYPFISQHKKVLSVFKYVYIYDIVIRLRNEQLMIGSLKSYKILIFLKINVIQI